MKSLTLLIFLLGFAMLPVADAQSKKPMSIKQIGKLLKPEVLNLQGENGGWQMEYGGKLVMVVCDESANRMRIFSPVIEDTKLEKGQVEKMLSANFHSALDAKYSVYEGFVVSVFTHPLKELTDEQFMDALRQVVVLNLTFGTTYQSTDMIFNPGGPDAPEEEQPAKEEKVRKS